MKQEAILLEQLTLAEEILEKGSAEGRGIRLAALVLRLNEAMMVGKVPHSWRPPAATADVLALLPPEKSTRLPSLADLLAAVDAGWDDWEEVRDEDLVEA